jgi:hypothetical protein
VGAQVRAIGSACERLPYDPPALAITDQSPGARQKRHMQT